MRSLVAAGLARLWRSRIFWVEMLVMIGEMLIMLLDQRFLAKSEAVLDVFLLYSVKELGIYIAVFADIFLGREYRDNAVRNKLMSGHGRSEIYLSFFITCCVSGLFFLVNGVLTASVLGLPFYGAPQLSPLQLLTLLVLAVMMTGAFCAIYTMVTMLAKGRFPLALPSYLFTGLLSILAEEGLYTSQGESFAQDISGSASALAGGTGGILRTLYGFLWDFLPVAQSMQLETGYVAHPLRLALYSVLIMLGTTMAGILLFQRKDME